LDSAYTSTCVSTTVTSGITCQQYPSLETTSLTTSSSPGFISYYPVMTRIIINSPASTTNFNHYVLV
jgi:hypothetical protein